MPGDDPRADKKSATPPAWWDMSASSSGADAGLKDEIAALREKIREDRAAKAPATAVDAAAFADDVDDVTGETVEPPAFSDRTDIGVNLPVAEPSVLVPVIGSFRTKAKMRPASPVDDSVATDPTFKPGVPDPAQFGDESDATAVAPPPSSAYPLPAEPPRAAGAPPMVGAPYPASASAYPQYAAPSAGYPPAGHPSAVHPGAVYPPSAAHPATGHPPVGYPAAPHAASPPASYPHANPPASTASHPTAAAHPTGTSGGPVLAPMPDELPSVRLDPGLVDRRPPAPAAPAKPLISDDLIRVGVFVVGGLIVLMICVIIVGVLVSMLSDAPASSRLEGPRVTETRSA